MAAIMDVLHSYLDRDTLEVLGKRVGAEPSIVQRVVSMALPMLVGGLSRNVNRSPQERSSLNSALEHDHDGSLLNSLDLLLRGGGAPGGGLGGLAGALGDRRAAIEEGTARASGLDRGSVGSLLVALAPMLMSALGRVKRERHLDEEGVARSQVPDSLYFRSSTTGRRSAAMLLTSSVSAAGRSSAASSLFMSRYTRPADHARDTVAPANDAAA